MMKNNKHYPMKCDVREKENKYILEMDLPGYKKENIKARIENGYLVVSAENEKVTNEQHLRFVRQERYTGQVSRSFYLGDDISQEEIKAEFKHGVLKFEIPKKTEKQMEKQTIAIEG